MSTSIFYTTGYDLALQNAKTLLAIADSACNEGAYGIACSLNILSSEETLKAGFLSIKCHNPDGKLNEFNSIFHNHRVKHEQLKEFVEFQDKMQIILKGFVEIHEPIMRLLKETSTVLQLNNKVEIDDIADDLLLFKKNSELCLNIPGILDWLRHANDKKNRGFYVDKKANSWLSPIEIQKKEFIVEREYTISFIEYVENTNKVFSMLGKIKNSANMG